MGSTAGQSLSDASQTTLIGYSADPSSNSGASNQIVIGYNATGIGNNYAVIGNADVSRLYAAQDGGAVIYANSTINASDRRVKKEIQDLDYGLDYVKSLRPVSYYKKDPANYPQALKDALYPDGNVRVLSEEERKLQVGFIAQEVKQVNDEMGLENNVVMVDEVGFHRMDYEKIVVPLVKAVQEQQEQIEALQRQYAQVTSQNQELMKFVSTQLLKKNDAEVKLIRSDESNNDDDQSDAVITSMK
jgi:cell division protein FtsB